MAGPCTPWTDADAVLAIEDYSNLDRVVLDEMVAVGSEILYDLSGRQFSGVCTDVVRPCARNGWCDYPTGWSWVPTWGACACARSACSCGLSSITLGAYPLREITEVLIDGAVLTSAAYRIDDRRNLVRVDGDAWPYAQDLALPTTAENTFQVAFEWGQAPTPAGVLAAKVFAAELTLCMTGKENRLPARVQTAVREGFTVSMLDPMTFIDDGKTGLYLVDLFLHAKNPGKAARRAQVFSPDFPKPVTRTATTPGS